MEGKEAIIESILASARRSAESLVAEAEAQHERAVSAVRIECERQQAEKRNALLEECNRIIARKLMLARLEARKNVLERKQRAIASVYALAETRLLADAGKYAALMKKLTLAAAEEGDELVLGKDDKALDKKWLAGLQAELKVHITVSKEKHDERGVILRGIKSDKSLTVPQIMSDLRARTETEVAEMLFGGTDEGK